MTKNELNRFQAILIAGSKELERLIRHRDSIRIERTADQVEQIQVASERELAVSNLDREFNQLRNARAAILRIPRCWPGRPSPPAWMDCSSKPIPIPKTPPRPPPPPPLPQPPPPPPVALAAGCRRAGGPGRR